MARHRIKRVNEQLKREISRILLGEVKDPRVSGVTVTDVSAAPDLTLARVFVQLIGDEDERTETMDGLRKATPFIRATLGNRIEMRRVPELRFERDVSMERAMRIEELLAEASMGEEREPEEPPSEEGAGDGGEAGDPEG